jgi:hypothetical protein
MYTSLFTAQKVLIGRATRLAAARALAWVMALFCTRTRDAVTRFKYALTAGVLAAYRAVLCIVVRKDSVMAFPLWRPAVVAVGFRIVRVLAPVGARLAWVRNTQQGVRCCLHLIASITHFGA